MYDFEGFNKAGGIATFRVALMDPINAEKVILPLTLLTENTLSFGLLPLPLRPQKGLFIHASFDN